MNAQRPNPPGDDEVDALLARRYRDTSPELEARWVALKRDLRAVPVRRPWPWSRPALPRWVMLGGVAAAAMLLLAVVTWRRGTPVPVEVSPALAELFAMDAVLSRATPLLDVENREALLHLPAQPQPRT